MKNPIEILKTVPKEIIEAGLFVLSTLFGSMIKMFKLNEKGIKITFRKAIVEAFSSLFIAMIVYAVFNQFLSFNLFFTCAMCSLAGSMSSTIHSHLEDFLGYLFDLGKKKINKYTKL